MKNVTLSTKDELLTEARRFAIEDGTTLNNLFREWMAKYLAQKRAERFDKLMDRVSYVRAGRKFTREEMNER